MKRRSKASAGLQSIFDPRLEKPLLHLHAAINVDSFWQAVQDVIRAALPTCFVGLTLQHSPFFPRIAKSTETIARTFFPIAPVQKYFSSHAHRNVVPMRDFFSDECHFKRSSFYRDCMAPINGRCAIGLLFWDLRYLLAAIIVVPKGDLLLCEMKLVRHLHAQFQTALGRLRSLERERAVRVAFEKLMRRVPLPTALLRWNLRLVYQNQAAAKFCALWQKGSSGAHFIKWEAPLPPEILNQCRVLEKRWQRMSSLHRASVDLQDEIVRHPTRHDLRATVSLKQTNGAAVARPHFLVQFENLCASTTGKYLNSGASLSHLVRLTNREQSLARLVCDGRSNQEIADESGLSLETVKKHLHSIFCKLKVPSRTRLMALMR
jgi:DNA-binding CsgD family transcriptional regulator